MKNSDDHDHSDDQDSPSDSYDDNSIDYEHEETESPSERLTRLLMDWQYRGADPVTMIGEGTYYTTYAKAH